MIIDEVSKFLKKYQLEDKTIIVGFSGGFDSMCLLDVLSKLHNTEEFKELNIIAAHFNHNWRGAEALKEQEICKLFASSKGFEFYTKTGAVPLKKSENEARLARYEFFEDAYEYYDADAVFTAHNRDDNAETVLYRVIKGTGLVGLKGISEKRDYFYRPILNISRTEILKYCEENNLIPNFDSSNDDIQFKRNFLRLNVIPILEKINTNVKDSLCNLAKVARSEDLIIEEYLEILRKNIYDGEKLISVEYAKLSKPVKFRILHEFVQKLDLDYDYKKINEIYEFIENNITQKNGSTLSLATSLWLYVDNKIIETIPPKVKKNSENINVIIDDLGEYYIGDKKLTIKKYEEKELFVFPEATSNFVYVDLSKIKMPLTIRIRQDGDMISPFGMSGSMKLKKYLNSKCIPRHNRDNLLLLTDKKEILWVIGVGISNKIGVVDTPTHVIEINNR
ncbi:MAG: tRNA lysidine(34) synthetase TilS [bacterium]|nr:tRNA lysidine(34) synthetase TilS [bacterium]